MRILVPLRTRSLTNQREHWRARHARAKKERRAVAVAFLGRLARPELPIVVTLTRVSPRELDDDNLRGALKSVRDEVAARYSVDDRDPLITWEYAQRKGTPKQHAVEIEIVERDEAALIARIEEISAAFAVGPGGQHG